MIRQSFEKAVRDISSPRRLGLIHVENQYLRRRTLSSPSFDSLPFQHIRAIGAATPHAYPFSSYVDNAFFLQLTRHVTPRFRFLCLTQYRRPLLKSSSPHAGVCFFSRRTGDLPTRPPSSPTKTGWTRRAAFSFSLLCNVNEEIEKVRALPGSSLTPVFLFSYRSTVFVRKEFFA